MARATAGGPVGAGPRRGRRPLPIGDVDARVAAPVPTGVGELDRVLGGGLVPGSVTLLGGEPGMGKSTLLLQALGRMAGAGTHAACSSPPRSRARRCGCGPSASARCSATCSSSRRRRCRTSSPTSTPSAPEVLAVDSIQTVVDPDLPGAPGSVTQVRDCAYRLVQQAKERALSTVLVGHVTKEGTLAGPRVLEHVVDTVLSFDGDRGHSLRLLHALKHRFGGTDELGLFEMTERGLVDVPDASARFLVDRRPGRAGLGGRRGARGRAARCWSRCRRSSMRTARAGAAPVGAGLDVGPARAAPRGARAARGREARAGADVYASVAGGLRVTEPGLDLAVALAVAGRAARSRRSPPDTVAIGELGLGGEVRSVPQLERRLAEAARLGFHAARSSRPGAPRPSCAVAGLRGDRTVGSAGVTPCEQALSPRRAEHRRRIGDALRLSWSPRRRTASRDVEDEPAVPAPPRSEAMLRRPRGSSRRARRCARASTASSRRSMGALIVIGDGPDVLVGVLRRLPARRRVHAPAALGAGEDGRRDHPRRPTARASPAPTCTSCPTPTSPRSETGTRHRTAERVGRQIDVPVITVSEDMSVVADPPARREAHARADRRACSPAPTRRSRSSSATRPGSTR